MTRVLRGLVALGALGTIAAAPSAWDRGAPSFELECGTGTAGVPGVVVVHLLDQGSPPHGTLTLKSGALDAGGLDTAELGEIDIQLNVGGHQLMCGAVPPQALYVRGTAKLLNGTTLRVLAKKPVRVEFQNSTGKLLTFRIVDPASQGAAKIAW